MSDRILVMREGRQMAIFDRDEATQERVLTAAMGQRDRTRRRRRRRDACMTRLLLRSRPARAAPRAHPRRDHHRGRRVLRVRRSRTTCRHAHVHPRSARASPIIAVVAVGQTLVVLTRNIDLSVGSIVGARRLRRRHAADATIQTCRRRSSSLIAIGIGAALGAINGLLVAYGRVPGDRHDARHAGHLPGRCSSSSPARRR